MRHQYLTQTFPNPPYSSPRLPPYSSPRLPPCTNNGIPRLPPCINGINGINGRRAISTEASIKMEKTFGANNYNSLPVVYAKGKGALVWDPEGREYLDFVAGISSVNQGHSHPKILDTFIKQASNLQISSRAVYNDQFGAYAKFITEYFGFDMVLPTNTGAEAVETVMKLARKWGYNNKGIPENEAIILSVTGNYHGRTIATISMSTDPSARNGFGPFLANVGPVCPLTKAQIPFNDIKALESALEHHGEKTAAFIVEPIQGEAGIIVPDDGYLKKAFDLCKKHNVLFVTDEIQTGLGRTGKLNAHDYDTIKPDMMTLGKSLSGGFYPVSAVLGRSDVLLSIKPGEHGSTFGGNPIHSAVAITALQVIRDEGLVENSFEQGQNLRKWISDLKSPIISQVRGKGLLNALVIDESRLQGKTSWDLCLELRDLGLVTRPTHGNVIRLIPPLCITTEQVKKSVDIFEKALVNILGK